MSFVSESFANRELLVEALKEMGFEQITEGTSLILQGWDKSDERTADIIIRRESVKNKRMLGDIGFQKTSGGYVAVIDDTDLNYQLGADFVTRLQTQYHEATARQMARNLKGTLIKEKVGQTIKIRVRF